MTYRELSNGTEVAAWLLRVNPEVWDIVAYAETGDPITTFRLTEGPRVDLMTPGDPCVLWVTGKRRHNFRPGVWAVGEVTEDAWENEGDEDDEYWLNDDERRKERPYVGVNLRFLPEPVPEEVFTEHPQFADAEIMHTSKMGNPLVLRPAEYAVIEVFLDENDLWPEDPALTALLDEADALAIARVEADGWTVEEADEPPYLAATRGDITRELFVASTTSGHRFPLAAEEYDEMEAAAEPLLLVVVAIPELGLDRAGGITDIADDAAEGAPVRIVAVHEDWRPARELYNRTSQLHTW